MSGDKFVNLREEIKGMSDADALSYVLDYFDYLFPKPRDRWNLEGVPLNNLESRVLRALWDRKGKVCTYQSLYSAMYGDKIPENWTESDVLKIYIHRLRAKTKSMGVEIRNERSVGYCLTRGELNWTLV